MAFKTMDDIERDKNVEKRKNMRKDISEDINEVIGSINIFKKPEKRKKSFIDWIFNILKILGVLILVLIVINFVLGNIWLLKFFMKSLFGVNI